MTGPFANLSVLELGQMVAVPYCAQLFADAGAAVTKIEPLQGDSSRAYEAIVETEGRQFLNKNRGKRSAAVDLRHPAVAGAVRNLATRADVVLVNLRPGLAEELGLDYPTLRRSNPRLIYATNSAYGPHGPRAGASGIAMMLQAYAGASAFDDAGPTPFPDPMADYAAALLMAWGVSAALYHRERTGAGQRLELSLLQAVLVLQNNSINHVDVLDGWRTEFVAYLKEAFARGESWSDVLRRRAEMRPSVRMRAYMGYHRTRDGVIAVGAAKRELQRRLLSVLDLEDRWVTEPGWEPDDAHAHAADMQERIERRLITRTTDAWLRALDAAGVPASPVRMPEQALDDPQLWENGYLMRLEHELVGGLTVVAPPVTFDETPLRVTSASPPLGAHTREVLLEGGLEAAEIDRLAATGRVRC